MTAYEDSDEYCPHCDNHYVSTSASEPLRCKFVYGTWLFRYWKQKLHMQWLGLKGKMRE